MEYPDHGHEMRLDVDDLAHYIYLCEWCSCTVDAPNQGDQETEPNEAYP